MVQLALLFIGVTSVEALLLLEVLDRFGLAATFALVVSTGVIGAALARAQGLAVLGRISSELSGGGVPARALLEGVVILIAAALLMTPGLLTDCIGFGCLLPPLRTRLVELVERWARRQLAQGNIHFSSFPGSAGPGEPTIDVEFHTEDAERSDRRDRSDRDWRAGEWTDPDGRERRGGA